MSTDLSAIADDYVSSLHGDVHVGNNTKASLTLLIQFKQTEINFSFGTCE